MKMTFRVLAILALAGWAVLAGGCATPANSSAMVAAPAAPVHQIGSEVALSVSGGSDTSKMGASQISDASFQQALQESIEKSSLFAKVVPSGGRYKLAAFIGKVDQPMMGFSMTVKMEVTYTLTDTQSNKAVWSKDIESQYTASAGAAFAGVTRLRLADEGAARENIQQAIAAMAALTL